MDLFSQMIDRSKNYLPSDGVVHYYGPVLSGSQLNVFLEKLVETVEWRNDEVVLFGKRIVTKRKVAWYGEKPYKYTYSNSSKFALPWTKELLELKRLVEEKTGETFNACLLNLYHNGSEGMGWHSDDEKELSKYGAIASLSLGSERRFVFKHKKSKEKVELMLQNGSLLVMKGETQRHWLHSLPPMKRVHSLRVNLTFRMIEES